MVLPALADTGFLGTWVVLLDYWIVVLFVLALVYLLYRLPSLANRRVAVTYIVFMSITVFWSIRTVASRILPSDRLYLLSIVSLIANIGVVVFIGYLFYQFSRLQDVDQVLEEFDLAAQPEEGEKERDEEAPVSYENLDAGKTYLVLEQGGEHGLELFRDAVERSPGLCFTYKNPNQVRQRLGLEHTPIVWFSGNERLGDNLNTMDPDQLDVLDDTVIDFVEAQRGKGLGVVVIIDGIEILLYNNSFTRFMTTLNGLISRYGGANDVTIIISAEESRIDEQQLSLLQQEVDEMRRAPSSASALR
ncbi:MAG: DUF835 domain-containing protein [Candidatus Nanohaloarchaea archaeon]|nr:DUF835 domain-containing protein [Candidatus Nanohaloarchaea archaeon]